MQFRVFNLISGEQIIGEIEPQPDYYKIINPFYITDAMDESGILGSKITKVLTFSASDYIIIDNNKIVFSFVPSESMIDYYKKLVEYAAGADVDSYLKHALEQMNKSEERYKKLISMMSKPTLN